LRKDGVLLRKEHSFPALANGGDERGGSNARPFLGTRFEGAEFRVLWNIRLIGVWRAIFVEPSDVPQQLSQIPIFPARYPDLGKAIFQHQPQNQLRILAPHGAATYADHPLRQLVVWGLAPH
jgi:hypothetical protein